MKVERDLVNSITISFPVREAYTCELTKELDSLVGFGDTVSKWYHHYVMKHPSEQCICIRMPGRTVGAIYTGIENIITKIVIDSEYRFGKYPDNVNEVMEKYIGQTLILND